jgi:methyltransferase (TIGR00027 family)
MRESGVANEVGNLPETALLTAGWRAMETERPDAMFHDPLAARLAGERGLRIARTLPDGAWVVAMRTPMIDGFLSSAIASGIDTVLDLAAGLDARPYRMNLPPSLRWVEVDLPIVLDRKIDLLRDETAACRVERFGLDLTDREARRELIDTIDAGSSRSIAVTEGFIGYLSTDDVGSLAEDLRRLRSCELLVTECFSARLLRAYRRHQPLRSAPVLFDPDDWEAFFWEHGWRVGEIRYLGEESRRVHRPVPLTVGDKLLRLVSSAPLRDMGYALLERVE